MFPLFDDDNTSEEQKWQLIESAIDIALDRSISMAETDRVLRFDNGFTYRVEDFRTLYREKAGFQQSFSYPARLRMDVKFKPERLPESTYFIPQKFRYIASMDYFDDDKQRVLTKTFGIDSNQIMKRGDAEELLLNLAVSKYPEFSGFEPSFKYMGVLRGYEI